jgi:hypothetical protein
MQARPALVERGRAAGRHKKLGVELWTPTVVGRNYRVARSAGSAAAGVSARPRMHWRRGHFRQQAVGPRGGGAHKTIWLEPTLVAAGGDQERTL